jgi:hypothetical protein
MVNEHLYLYQTVVDKQTVVHLIPIFKNFFNPFFVLTLHSIKHLMFELFHCMCKFENTQVALI